MDLNLSVPIEEEVLSPRITVIGVGGAGGNAVNNMISSNLEGVEFVIANTDSQAMRQSLCERRIQLGRNITAGLGAGSRPDVGRAAAEEALDDILAHLEGTNMVFITAGMGGGTGTGAAPVIARAAREAGILTVGVVTKPFQFEGIHRMRLAENGIQELTEYVDTLIIIPNQNLFRVATEKTTFADAFKMADDVLHSGVRGVTDLMVMPGLINLDFADIRSVMTEMGKAMMGTGEAEGEGRSIAAAEAAISNPLLDDVSMRGARGVLINITGGMDMTLFEVDEAANRIREEVDPEANIIFGSTFDEALNGQMRVSVVATGIEMEMQAAQPRPVSLSVVGAQAAASADRRPATPPLRPAARPAAQAPAQASAMAIERVEQSVPFQRGAVATAQAAAPAYQEEPEMLAEPESDEMLADDLAPALEQGPDEEMGSELESGSDSYIPPEPMRVENRNVPPAVRGEQPRAAAPNRAPQRPQPEATAYEGRPARQPEGPTTGAMLRNKASSLFGGSIFNKVTGGAKSAPQEPRSEARAEQRPAQRSESRVEPRMDPRVDPRPAARPEPSLTAPRQPAARPQSEAPQQQPSLGLDPRDRLQASKEEEEMLDIPAFLRRQAN